MSRVLAPDQNPGLGRPNPWKWMIFGGFGRRTHYSATSAPRQTLAWAGPTHENDGFGRKWRSVS